MQLQCLHEFTFDKPIEHASSDGEGNLFTTGKKDFQVLDASGTVTATVSHGGTGLVIAANSCFIVHADGENFAKVFNKFSHSEMARFEMYKGHPATGITMNEKYAVVTSGSKNIIINIETVQQEQVVHANKDTESVVMHNDKLYVMVRNSVSVHPMSGTWEREAGYGADGGKFGAAIGNLLYAAVGPKVFAMDIDDPKETKHTLQGHADAITGMCHHGKTLFTCSDDKTIKVWDLNNHGLVNSLTCAEAPMGVVIWNGQLASYHKRGSGSVIRVWGKK